MNAKRFFFVCLMHIAVGAFQIAWAGTLNLSLGGCDANDIICSTPLEGFLMLIREQPSISIGFAISLITNLLTMIWGLLSFDYALFSGDSILTSTIGYVFRLGLGLIGLEVLSGAISNILQTIRG